MKYRPDIDGLRALAVLAVILFHLDYPLISGGFVGVDIFFVISGYLISNIIYKKIANDDFSILSFYQKRVLRIVPVLLVFIIVTIVIGYFVLLSNEYINLAKSSIATLGFVANIYFWNTTGYFEVEAHNTPLLHTWSLGVEEQFYIVFPVILLFTLKFFSKFQVIHVMIVLFVMSFMANIYFTMNDITFSFYMIFTRTWELLAGVLVMFLLQKKVTNNRIVLEIAAFFGVILIFYSIFVFDKNMLFPGYYAAIPVLGTVLFIYSGYNKKPSLINIIVSNKIFVAIGLISYSLYLWHWPITIYINMLSTSPHTRELILLISFLLSIISYIYIEKPFRKISNNSQSIKNKYIVLLLLFGVVILLSFTIINSNGVESRMSDDVIKASNLKTYLPENRPCRRLTAEELRLNQYCIIGSKNTIPSFALIGDSHAEALKYGLKLAALNKNKAGIQVTKSGCRPLIGIDRIGKSSCIDFINSSLEYIKNNKNITTVFLTGYWSISYHGFGYRNKKFRIYDQESDNNNSGDNKEIFLTGLNRTISVLLSANKRVIVIGDTPEIGFNSRNKYARNIFLNKEQNLNTEYSTGINHVIKQVVQEYHGKANYMSTEEIICPQNPCLIVRNNQLIFRDGDHITRYASGLLSERFEKYL